MEPFTHGSWYWCLAVYVGCSRCFVWLSMGDTGARGLPAHPNSTPVCITQVCSLVGGLLNVLRIPERWLQPKDPGCAAPLDYLLNSHQIMHLLVAVAMWQLHLGATADYHTVSALLAGTEQCS